MTKRKVTNYPLEFKQSSAQLAATSDNPVSQTAKELGVHEKTLSGWVNKYYPRPKQLDTALRAESEELQRLRKENVRLKQERDILKKAAAYFASEM